MIILGIDPGLATLGYGVIEKNERGNCRAIDCGVVVTPKEEGLPVRLAMPVFSTGVHCLTESSATKVKKSQMQDAPHYILHSSRDSDRYIMESCSRSLYIGAAFWEQDISS